MTVKQLIERLQELNAEADVYIPMTRCMNGDMVVSNVCVVDIDGDILIG